MYVTGGQYKGRRVIIPDCAKPTLSKTRQAVFNILYSLENSFEGKIFLDLFSGSGLISLEALSRGFKTFSVDSNISAIKTIKKNLEETVGGSVIKSDVMSFISNSNIKPDVVYLDPPWDNDYGKILKAVYEKYKSAVIFVEYDKKRAPELGMIYAEIKAPFKEKVYGRCVLGVLAPKH